MTARSYTGYDVPAPPVVVPVPPTIEVVDLLTGNFFGTQIILNGVTNPGITAATGLTAAGAQQDDLAAILVQTENNGAASLTAFYFLDALGNEQVGEHRAMGTGGAPATRYRWQMMFARLKADPDASFFYQWNGVPTNGIQAWLQYLVRGITWV